MTHLIFALSQISVEHLGATIEKINSISNSSSSNKIVFVSCDRSVGMCMGNMSKDPALCRLCKARARILLKCIKAKNVEYHTMSTYNSPEIASLIKSYKFEYNTVKELKELSYEHSKIGLAVLSSYITQTRHLNPIIDSNTKQYFNDLLKVALQCHLVSEVIINKVTPDHIVFYNGRTITTRPIYENAKSRNIDFTCLEVAPFGAAKDFLLVEFRNAFALSIPYNAWLSQHNWELGETLKNRDVIAKSFFENRRNSIFAGDKVYTAHQKRGLLPDNWSNDKENIVIFNSSEDEFYAIGGEWDDNKLFDTQLEGIKAMLEHYKDDKSKQFYLKIHPNLIPVKYKYHTDLYELRYENLTIVEAVSPVSTYEMIDSSSKVIVFGSTTGVEAVYAKKPVIQLSNSLYNFTQTVYIPNTLDELWSFIDNKELPTKYNDEILKYGFFIMQPMYALKPKLNISLIETKVLGKNIEVCAYAKLLGSRSLFAIYSSLVLKLSSIFGSKAKYKTVPSDEA